MNEVNCYYCGMNASGIDYIIPTSVIFTMRDDGKWYEEVVRGRKLEVPCCKECNCLLGATVQETLQERKYFLKMKLRKRYAQYLAIPKWTEQELNELGQRLRQEIERSIEFKKLLKMRLSW